MAVTRAGRHLYLTFARNSTAKGRYGISRYLKGLPGIPESVSEGRQRPGRRPVKLLTCRVCGGPLTAAADRKLGHHMACEVDVDPAVVDRLRAWRLDRAHRDKVPAFVVLTDATLLAVAEQMPAGTDELQQISGIGPSKIERYSDELLKTLDELRD